MPKKIKILKVIKKTVKEIKPKQESVSELEQEIENDEDRQFSNFMASRSGTPFLSPGGLGTGEGAAGAERNAPGAPVIPQQSETEQLSGAELYRTGRGLGDERQAYVSSMSSSGNILRPRAVGSDFAMPTSSSSLPENQLMDQSRGGLERQEIGADKYEASSPAEAAAKKFKYEWE